MEWLSNFKKPFEDRAKSPLYGAFVVTWLFWNWRIIVALFFVKLQERGGKTVIEFIDEKYLNCCDGLLIPLAISIGFYIFLLPKIDLYIIGYWEKIKQEKLKKKLEIQRNYSVPGEKYINLLEEKNKQAELVDKYYSEVLELKGELEDKNQENNGLKESLRVKELQFKNVTLDNELHNKRNNPEEKLNGRWAVSYNYKEAGRMTKESINIQGHEMQIYNATGGVQKLKIEYVDYHHSGRLIMICKYEGKLMYVLYNLRIISPERFEGYQNEDDVLFIRESPYSKMPNPSEKGDIA